MTAFEHQRRIGFADMDPAGIVFYPRYFEMLNETVEAWFRDGLDYGFDRMILQDRHGVPLARVEAEFTAPSRLDDQLVFRLSVEQIGGASVTLRIRALCGEEQRFTAQLTLVYLDIERHAAIRIGDAVRERMTAYLERAR